MKSKSKLLILCLLLFKMHLLDSDQIVNRKNIGKIFNAPTEEVMDALTSVAFLDKSKTWKLLVTETDTLLETYVLQIDQY